MREFRLTAYQFKDLVETYDIHLDEAENFLNIETGDIVMLARFDDGEDYEELSEKIEEGLDETYFLVPHRDSNEGFKDMEDFTRTVADERLQDRLWDALSSGRGVFRRFKDTLAYDKQEMDRYYKYLEQTSLKRIMEWFEENDLKPTIDMTSEE